MMASQVLSAKERSVRLISRIQSEHISQIRQRRENHRQPISMPGTIRMLDETRQIDTLTRDLSSEGIGLITAEPVSELDYAEIELFIGNCNESMFARCCWCQPSGCFYLSGWKFINDPA